MSPRLSTLIILLLLMHMVLSACAEKRDEPETPGTVAAKAKVSPANPVLAEAPKVTMPVPKNSPPAEWLPQRVSLTCSAASCPVQVGVLLFVAQVTQTNAQIYRCTAFLIDNDKIASNGHCDFTENAEGFFFTRTDAPERTVRRVSRRLFKEFTPGRNEEESSGRPDAAVFQLESAITNIQPLQLARGATPAYPALTAVVVNSVPGKDDLTFAVGEVTCAVRRNERIFPYELAENPDVLTVFDCTGEKGNSGSPMFAPNSLQVEAVLEGASNLTAFAEVMRKQEHRELHAFEKHPTISATNARCLSYPAKPAVTCLQVSEEKSSKRFTASVATVLDGTAERSAPGGPYQTGFKPMLLALKNGDFELQYIPVCRLSPTVTNFAIPTEQMRLEFDEWGKAKLTSLASAVSPGSVLDQDAGHIKVTMNWQKAFGEFENPDKDLRAQLKQTFSIALPACAR